MGIEAADEAKGHPAFDFEPPSLWITVAAALLATALFWPFRSIDMGLYLVPWLDHILEHGQIGAFSEPFSNYTPPYLYLLAAVSPLAAIMPKVAVIKLLSLFGTFWLLWAVNDLLRAAGARGGVRAAALLLALPSVIINAALFGQCDAMWTAASVSAVACAIRGRTATMLVWCGLAFALKAQAAFLAPFVVAFLLAERAPWRLWLIPPAVFVAAMVPAWAAGWPASDLATIYLRQAQWFEQLSLNAPNIWMIVQQYPASAAIPASAIASASAVAFALGYVLVASRRRFDPADMVAAALLVALALPGLLPRMHERYFFLADVLALALALIDRSRAAWLILLAVEAASTVAIFSHLARDPVYATAAASAMIMATAAVALRVAGRLEPGRGGPRPALAA